MLIIGLMSGTSVDSIDVAVMEINGVPGSYQWKLISHISVDWPEYLHESILGLCRPDAPLQSVVALHTLAGEKFAKAAVDAYTSAGLTIAQVDAIASHGQTIWHEPNGLLIGGGMGRGTCQIGDASVIAARTGCKVISDFRSADMALGGQGAPLVPFVDFALFASSEETRAVQNIGGIANVTYLIAGGTLQDVIAFDTGPGNMLLDALAYRVTEGRLKMDLDGQLAGRGKVQTTILNRYLEMVYLHLPPPKSTGRELFGAEMAEWFYQDALRLGCNSKDILTTATAFTVETIGLAYEKWLSPHGKIQTVILGGGGVRNPVLVEGLTKRLSPARITNHSEFGMADAAKEAAAFAFLAYETLHGRPSNVPSATGASGPAILGKISLPPC